VVATIGNTYAYLLGGAVLIEAIFSWGGVGQYAVQAVESSDYFAVSGVVLVTSFLALLVYLAVDLINAVIDPASRT
jgi:peptide/nickel transport system permease protein